MGTVAWNPRTVSPPEPQLPPPQPDVRTSSTHSLPPQASGTTNNAPAIAAPEPKLVQFTPTYLPGNEGERPSFIPRTLAEGSQPKQHSTAGLEADDPRRSLIEQGYQVQDLDREANALADQAIDVEGARAKVQTSTSSEEQFWTGVYSKLTQQQNKELKSLAAAIETSPDKAAAQAKFDSTLTPLLSAQQRTQLQTVQRQTQDAQIELNGQIIGQRLRDAQLSGDAEQLSLARADARVHVSDKHQLIANRKVEDAYALVMTPENQSKLAAPQKAVVDAVQQLSLNPGDKAAQQRVTDAKKALDDAQAQALSAEDKTTLDMLETAAERERDLGGLLVQEAQAERRYVELSAVEKQRPLNETERRILDLAKADFDVVQKNRGMRDLAVEAANADEGGREEALTKLDAQLTEFMRAKSDADIKRAEFTKEVAQSGAVAPAGITQDTSAGKMQTVALTQTTSVAAKQPLTVGKEFAVDMPSTDLTVEQATKQLDAVKAQRGELEEMLKPPAQPQKSGWDRALDIIAGVGEVIGGVAVMAFAGWTGIGAVAGGAIALDGLLRLGHSISDAARGTTTDTWQSQGFQALGASRETANRVDTGLNLVATVPVGVGGAAIGAVKASTMLMKSVNVAGGVTVIDGAQAGTRYVATGEHANPFMVDGLMKAGLSPTQANYALMGGNLVATGGAVAAARGRSASVQPTSSTTTPPATTTVTNTTTATTGTTQAATTSGTSATTGATQAANTTATSATTGATQTTGTTTASSATTSSTTQAANTTGTTTSGSANAGATNGTNNVSSQPQPVNASGLDPSTNPWGPEGKGGKGVTLLTTADDKGIGPRTDVAILGTSHVALTLGADIALNQPGLQTKILFRGDGVGVDRITEVAHLYDFMETLHTKVSQNVELTPAHFGYSQSAEGAAALQQAKTIVVTIPDKPQVRLQLFERLQHEGLVHDPAKTIVLIRGGQAGQPVLSQMIRENPNWKANMVLVEDSPYGTRVDQTIGDNGLPTIRAKRKDNVEITVLGHQGDSSIATGAMREMFPLDRGGNPWPRFDLVPGIEMPWRAGYFIHPGVAFDAVNLAKTDAGVVYYHYAQGVHPELGVKLAAIDGERVALAARYGVEADTFPQKLERQFGLELRDEPFHVTMARTGPKELGGENIYLSKSYGSLEKLMDSRYPTEDVPGLFTINWLAERSGGRTAAHIAYETEIRQTLRELGMSEHQMRNELGAYLPYLDAIEGGIPEITQLLNEPHVRPNA
jgi:opine dehydrogenase